MGTIFLELDGGTVEWLESLLTELVDTNEVFVLDIDFEPAKLVLSELRKYF